MIADAFTPSDHPLHSHLLELRSRVIIMLIAISLGAIAGWVIYPQAYTLVAGPLIQSIRAHGGQIFTLQPGEAFFTQCKLAVVIGLILASPVLVWQLWAFVRPALMESERKAIAPLMPAISLLFIAGTVFAHFLLPNIQNFFLQYVPQGISPNMDFQNSINFPLKLMLTFGLTFQLPILLLGLIIFHVLTPRFLLAQWKTAIVAIAVIAAIMSPSPDPFNMFLVMIPLLILFFATVLLAFWITRRGRRTG